MTLSGQIADDMTPHVRHAVRAALPVRSVILWTLLPALLPIIVKIVIQLLQALYPQSFGLSLAMSAEADRAWAADRLPSVKAALVEVGQAGGPPS